MALEIYDIYNAMGLTQENGTQTLINAIRNSSDLKGITQVYDGSVEGLKQFGVALERSTTVQNSFVHALVDRIGKVVVTKAQIKNPLAQFKKGRMDEGRSVEEIFTDLIKAKSFNPEDAQNTLFKRSIPNVRVLFHDNWRKERYDNTIERTTLKQAFTSLQAFEDFIVSTYDAMYNSNEVDEYLWSKALIESYVANAHATFVEVPHVTDAKSASEFVKKTRATATKMQLVQGSRAYNSAGVHTTTPKNRTWIMIDADLDATLDVDVLARAFQMSKTDIEQKKLVVEGFSVTGLEAVMFDEDIFKIYDKEFLMNSVENPKGLYWNTFLHVHQLFSMSKFNNFVAFMSSDIPTITKLNVTPVADYIKLNQAKTLDGFVEFKKGSSKSDVEFTTTITDTNNQTVSGVTAEVVQGNTDSNFTVVVKVSNKALTDQTIQVNVTATEIVGTIEVEGEEELQKQSKTSTALLTVVPEVVA